MKSLIVTALLLSNFAHAEVATLVATAEVPQNASFACTPYMESALKNKSKLVWNKIGIYAARGGLYAAPVIAGTTIGGVIGFHVGLGVAAAGPAIPEAAGFPSLYAFFFGAIGGGAASAAVPSENTVTELLKTRQEKIEDLQTMFTATQLSEKDLMDHEFERRVAEWISNEEKIRSDRNLPPLTEEEKLAIRNKVPYGSRPATFIDALQKRVDDKGLTLSYEQTRALVLSHASDETYCPLNRRGTDHNFMSMRKIVKMFRKTSLAQ